MSALPPPQSSIFEEVAEVIGDADARKLCEQLGGTTVYVPASIGPDHPIAEAIGTGPARLFADHFRGSHLPLPKSYLRKQLAIELINEGRLSDKEIAKRTDYTDRHIRNFRADMRDDRQLSLFG